jgi:hypothetical protein
MSLESKIDELIAALDRNTAVQSEAPKKVSSKKGTSEPAPTAASPGAQPATPAPVAATPASQPAAPVVPSEPVPDPKVLVKATEKVIELANNYSRDQAIAILAKRKVTKCSQLDPSQWQAVFDEAEEAVEKAKAASANASLV